MVRIGTLAGQFTGARVVVVHPATHRAQTVFMHVVERPQVVARTNQAHFLGVSIRLSSLVIELPLEDETQGTALPFEVGARGGDMAIGKIR